jgi:hypothetical protein
MNVFIYEAGRDKSLNDTMHARCKTIRRRPGEEEFNCVYIHKPSITDTRIYRLKDESVASAVISDINTYSMNGEIQVVFKWHTWQDL